jgi:hydroxymethylglutaryl-CoA lyase
MGGTTEVLQLKKTLPDVRYPVLVPNMKGLDALLSFLSTSSAQGKKPLTDEIAVFTATTDSFSLANTNATVSESLERLQAVTRKALQNGLRVRGYVSMVIDCPWEGSVDPSRVREVTEKLISMGCYEVSLGDTTGSGTPLKWERMLREVNKSVEMELLAVSFPFISSARF